jgi:hypothetical protein
MPVESSEQSTFTYTTGPVGDAIKSSPETRSASVSTSSEPTRDLPPLRLKLPEDINSR